MGGFTLVGDNYVISSTARVECRCTGFHGRIPKDVQDMLVQKHEYILNLQELPKDLREKMEYCHLPTDMRYTARKISPPRERPAPVYDPNKF